MNKELIFEDALLYIAGVLIAYGVIALDVTFVKGIIALGIAAIVVIVRTLLKKANILKRERNLINK